MRHRGSSTSQIVSTQSINFPRVSQFALFCVNGTFSKLDHRILSPCPAPSTASPPIHHVCRPVSQRTSEHNPISACSNHVRLARDNGDRSTGSSLDACHRQSAVGCGVSPRAAFCGYVHAKHSMNVFLSQEQFKRETIQISTIARFRCVNAYSVQSLTRIDRLTVSSHLFRPPLRPHSRRQGRKPLGSSRVRSATSSPPHRRQQ